MARVARPAAAVKSAALTSVAVAAAGFGVMNVFWAADAHDPELRGLYEYLSATFGDALCLPAAFGAVAYARATLPRTENERRAGTLAALAGTVAGAALQAAWLLDEDPELNWTLTAPHQMNAAGIYHAVFLTGMSAFGAWLLATAAVRANAVERPFDDPRRRRPLEVAAAAGAGFVVLLVLDNRAASGLAQGATLATVGVAALAATAGALWFRRHAGRGGRR